MLTANKLTENKLSELQGGREKAESDVQVKLRNLEEELENSNTSLADFKRRGNVNKISCMGFSADLVFGATSFRGNLL